MYSNFQGSGAFVEFHNNVFFFSVYWRQAVYTKFVQIMLSQLYFEILRGVNLKGQ